MVIRTPAGFERLQNFFTAIVGKSGKRQIELLACGKIYPEQQIPRAFRFFWPAIETFQQERRDTGSQGTRILVFRDYRVGEAIKQQTVLFLGNAIPGTIRAGTAFTAVYPWYCQQG
jgi:hypothetical protein